MNLSPDTLIDEVEPYLLRSELLVRTPRGRRLTAAAFEHLGLAPRTSPAAPASGRCFRSVVPRTLPWWYSIKSRPSDHFYCFPS